MDSDTINKTRKELIEIIDQLNKKLDARDSKPPRDIKDKDVLSKMKRQATKDITKLKQAEEQNRKFNKIIETTSQSVIITNIKGTVLYVNSSYYAFSGFVEDEVIGKSMFRFAHKKGAIKLAKEVVPALIKKGHWRGYMTVVKKDKQIVSVDLICSLLSDEKNKPEFFVAIFSDITERKQAEEALRKSEKSYRELVEKAGITILIDDREGNFAYFNETFTELFGYSAEEIKDKSIQSLVHPDDVDRVMQFHKERLQGKKVPSRYEFRGVRKDGSTIHMEVDTIELKEEESIVGTRSYIWDITERKRAEEAQKKLLHDVGERMKELNCLYGITQLTNNLDKTLEDVLQKTAELIPPSWQYPDITCGRIIFDDKEFKTKNFTESVWKQFTPIIIEGKEKGQIEVYYTRKMPESDFGPFMKEEKDLIEAMSRQLSDFYLKREAEIKLKKLNEELEQKVKQRTAELKDSEEKSKLLLESTSEGIFGTDSKGKIIFVNPAVEKILGFSADELIGNNAHPLFHHHYANGEEYPEIKCPIYHAFTKARTNRVDNEVLWKKDGMPIPVEYSATPMKKDNELIGSVITFSDITERKKAEEEIKYSESRFRNLFENSPIAYQSLNENGCYIDANEELLNLIGYSKDEIMGKAFGDFWTPETHKIFRDKFSQFKE
ncbi:MAG: PAS domain S-box protein, partial [Desulfobacteraceae bacterium]|nr:PAS domain S-box protein [Desulfobacteraceae bacterium]